MLIVSNAQKAEREGRLEGF